MKTTLLLALQLLFEAASGSPREEIMIIEKKILVEIEVKEKVGPDVGNKVIERRAREQLGNNKRTAK